MEDKEYDYDGYQKSLERTLAFAEKDYWTKYRNYVATAQAIINQ